MEIATALLQLRPGAHWSVPHDCTEAARIIWHDGTTPITQAELDAKLAEPEPPRQAPTPIQRLAAAGLTLDELKVVLGLAAPSAPATGDTAGPHP